LLPKRAHHHIGIEHMVPKELMVAKVREAVAARRNPETVIIARTNGVRASNMDDALARAEAYKEAGADVLLLSPRNPEELRIVSERLEPPLMLLLRPGGLAAWGMSLAEMHDHGVRILADPGTALFAIYETVKAYYADLADGFAATSRPPAEWEALEKAMHKTIGLESLIDVEKRTVEKG
jgi:methylisocitrate lyase